MVANGCGRLAKALAGVRQAEQELARRSAKAEELAVAARLEKDPRYLCLMDQVSELKRVRHQHRINLSRAKYSIRCQLDRLGKTRARLAAMEQADAAMTRELEATKQDESALRLETARAL